MKIRDVNERKKVGEQRDKLYAEWQELASDTDFDNDADAEEVWKRIAELDKDIEAFDKKFPDALKKALGKDTKASEDGLQKALAEIAKLNVPEAQKAALRKSVALAAKKFSGNRRRVYDDVASLDELEDELETAREQRDAMKVKLESMPSYQQEKYWDSMDEIENKVRELEAEVSVMQRQALKKLQDAKAAVADAVEEVKAVAEVHEPAAESADSDIVESAKAYYGTAFKAYKSYVAPHVPNDRSVETAMTSAANALLTEAEAVRAVAGTYTRDKRKQGTILAMASLFTLTGQSLVDAMKANDVQPKVADWRDVLKTVKEKATALRSSGDVDADEDAKKFTRIMRDLEPKYAEIFSRLPVGAASKPLLASVAAYEREAKYLREDGLANKSDKEMYPGFGHILLVVSDSMLRYGKLMRKALTK